MKHDRDRRRAPRLVGALAACVALAASARAEHYVAARILARQAHVQVQQGLSVSVAIDVAVRSDSRLVGVTRDGRNVFAFDDSVGPRQALSLLGRLNGVLRPRAIDPRDFDRYPGWLLHYVGREGELDLLALGIPDSDAYRGGSFVQLPARNGFGAAELDEVDDVDDLVLVEPDHLFRLAYDLTGPSDPKFTESKYWSLDAIGARRAWNVVTSSEAIVAVVDSGVNYELDALADNIVRDDYGAVVGYDFVDGDDDPQEEGSWHGTACASIIGEVGDDGVGGVGVCWRVPILPVRAFGADGKASASTLAKAIDWAVANGARIVNASWAGAEADTALEKSIDAALAAEVLVVTVAGNDDRGKGTSVDSASKHVYPACWNKDNLISVVALRQNGYRWPGSNYGPSSISLAAPGEYVRTVHSNGAGYLNSGTSFAAPFVAGGAALVWEVLFADEGTALGLKKELLGHVTESGVEPGLTQSDGMLDLSFLAPTSTPVPFYSAVADPAPVVETVEDPPEPSPGETDDPSPPPIVSVDPGAAAPIGTGASETGETTETTLPSATTDPPPVLGPADGNGSSSSSSAESDGATNGAEGKAGGGATGDDESDDPATADSETAADDAPEVPPLSEGERVLPGRLRTGVFAIGGETTGVELQTPRGPVDLDLGGDELAREVARLLHGVEVTVKGRLERVAGSAIEQRWVLSVEALTIRVRRKEPPR